MPKNAKKSPYLKREFELYVAWKSLPPIPVARISKMLDNLGIDQKTYRLLYSIKTQTGFAKRFGIKDLGTLTDWNKKIEEEGLVLENYIWAKELTPNILYALYLKAIKHGRAAEAKVWFKYVEDRDFSRGPKNDALRIHALKKKQEVIEKILTAP